MSKEKKPTKPSLNKNTLKTAKRLLGYVTKTYKVQFIIGILTPYYRMGIRCIG